jgi:hypothetical protein
VAIKERKGTVAERAAHNRVSEALQAAWERVEDRGVTRLYPTEWDAAVREEMGDTSTPDEREAAEQASIAAADARLACGEAALHAARVAAASGKLPQ